MTTMMTVAELAAEAARGAGYEVTELSFADARGSSYVVRLKDAEAVEVLESFDLDTYCALIAPSVIA